MVLGCVDLASSDDQAQGVAGAHVRQDRGPRVEDVLSASGGLPAGENVSGVDASPAECRRKARESRIGPRKTIEFGRSLYPVWSNLRFAGVFWVALLV